MKNTANSSDYFVSKRIKTVKASCPKKTVDVLLGLEPGDVENRSKIGQEILDRLCATSKTPHVGLKIVNSPYRSMKGCYRSVVGSHKPVGISIWNKTGAVGKPVSNLEFLKTLCHEFCHHYDYHALKLGSSLHTSGFYTRCDALVKKIRPKTQTSRSGQGA